MPTAQTAQQSLGSFTCQLWILLSSLALLSACGGGSGDGDDGSKSEKDKVKCDDQEIRGRKKKRRANTLS